MVPVRFLPLGPLVAWFRRIKSHAKAISMEVAGLRHSTSDTLSSGLIW